MHLCCEGLEIRIVSTDDDALVLGILAMEADEILPVVGEDGAAILAGKTQYLIVGTALL